MVEIIGALNAPRRREILRLVWEEERSAGDICNAQTEITFGAVSQHLGILLKAGLVSCREDGKHRYYRAQKADLGPLKSWLEAMWDSALYQLKVRAELEQSRRGPRPKRKRRDRK